MFWQALGFQGQPAACNLGRNNLYNKMQGVWVDTRSGLRWLSEGRFKCGRLMFGSALAQLFFGNPIDGSIDSTLAIAFFGIIKPIEGFDCSCSAC